MTESAFPTQDFSERGMSLRDYFAAAALRKLVKKANPDFSYTARLCYEVADAMLAERDRKEPE